MKLNTYGDKSKEQPLKFALKMILKRYEDSDNNVLSRVLGIERKLGNKETLLDFIKTEWVLSVLEICLYTQKICLYTQKSALCRQTAFMDFKRHSK